MTDHERTGRESRKRFATRWVAAEGYPRRERVLPADLDLDAELDRRFAQPGVGLQVAVV
ncbi:MAG TPA: hypothetical protein VMT17_13450 [Anaeromyxobacteraceae bacterium]|nr:hypothetical protein [Anaeromyxobacteraceae bacterium]